MMPGVTHLPVPSTLIASDGACTVAPTATIWPSRNRIDACGISCPAAVMIVALVITTGREGWRWYVDGYWGRLTLRLSAAVLVAPPPRGAGVAAAAGTAAGAARRPLGGPARPH